MIQKARPAEHAPINWHIKRATTAWAFFAFLAVLLLPSFANAEIKIAATTLVGKKIEAELFAPIPVGAEVQGCWVVPGCDTDLESPTKVQIWAAPGTHTVLFQGAWMQFELTDVPQADGSKVQVKSTKTWGFINESASFEVTGGVTPPPPDPANPYKPAPQYQAAVEPVKSLSLTKADSRALATLYSSIANQVRAGSYKNLGEIRAELVSKGKSLNLSGKYAGLAQAVDKYLSTTVGLEQVAPAATVGDVFETLAWAVYEAGRV